jgi:hypothetical protein
VDARSVLGVQPLRTSLLDDVSTAESRQTEARYGARVVTTADNLSADYVLDEDDDIDEDDDDDEYGDEDGEDDEDEDDDDEEEEIETWQVSPNGRLP